MILEAYPEAEILPFGSFKTKLYLPNADIDLVIYFPDTSLQKTITNIFFFLIIKKGDIAREQIKQLFAKQDRKCST